MGLKLKIIGKYKCDLSKEPTLETQIFEELNFTEDEYSFSNLKYVVDIVLNNETVLGKNYLFKSQLFMESKV